MLEIAWLSSGLGLALPVFILNMTQLGSVMLGFSGMGAFLVAGLALVSLARSWLSGPTDLVESGILGAGLMLSPAPFILSTLITLIAFIALSAQRSPTMVAKTVLTTSFLALLSLSLLSTASLTILLITFECIIFLSLNLMRLTSKADRASESMGEMFIWTVLGSFFILLGIFSHFVDYGDFMFSSTPIANAEFTPRALSAFLVIAGLGVKIPL